MILELKMSSGEVWLGLFPGVEPGLQRVSSCPREPSLCGFPKIGSDGSEQDWTRSGILGMLDPILRNLSGESMRISEKTKEGHFFLFSSLAFVSSVSSVSSVAFVAFVALP